MENFWTGPFPETNKSTDPAKTIKYEPEHTGALMHVVTCVCDESVGAEAHAVRQVGGELFRPEPQTPAVTERRFLKNHRNELFAGYTCC